MDGAPGTGVPAPPAERVAGRFGTAGRWPAQRLAITL